MWYGFLIDHLHDLIMNISRGLLRLRKLRETSMVFRNTTKQSNFGLEFLGLMAKDARETHSHSNGRPNGHPNSHSNGYSNGNGRSHRVSSCDSIRYRAISE